MSYIINQQVHPSTLPFPFLLYLCLSLHFSSCCPDLDLHLSASFYCNNLFKISCLLSHSPLTHPLYHWQKGLSNKSNCVSWVEILQWNSTRLDFNSLNNTQHPSSHFCSFAPSSLIYSSSDPYVFLKTPALPHFSEDTYCVLFRSLFLHLESQQLLPSLRWRVSLLWSFSSLIATGSLRLHFCAPRRMFHL